VPAWNSLLSIPAWALVCFAVLAQEPAPSPSLEPSRSLAPSPSLAPSAPAADRFDDPKKQLQQRLKDLGHYGGPVDGELGAETRAALARFQRSVPLPASGQLDEKTLAALGLPSEASASSGASAPGQAR
jgi:peptidoglycan hydrolase-like protein with peptidoglycan-binding domain